MPLAGGQRQNLGAQLTLFQPGGILQYTLDLRKPDLRKILGATNFLVHKLFDLRKIF